MKSYSQSKYMAFCPKLAGWLSVEIFLRGNGVALALKIDWKSKKMPYQSILIEVVSIFEIGIFN